MLVAIMIVLSAAYREDWIDGDRKIKRMLKALERKKKGWYGGTASAAAS
jgi:hypothetical protein